MRRIKFKLIAVAFCLLSFAAGKAYAVECVDLSDKTVKLQSVLTDYKNAEYSETVGNKTYQICFSGTKEAYTSILFVGIAAGDRLLLKNLAVTSSTDFAAAPLIWISSSGVTLDGAKLLGNEKGSAVRFAKNGVMKNSTITGFAEGARLAQGVGLTFANNTFVNMGSFNKLFIFDDDAVASPIDKNKIGKNVEDGKVVYIAGGLNMADDTCLGGVKVYKKETKTISAVDQAHCVVSKLEGEELIFGDGSEKLEDGSCYFKCENINISPDIEVGFVYLNSYGFVAAPVVPEPTKKINELSDVDIDDTSYSGAAPLSLPGAGNEMGGDEMGGEDIPVVDTGPVGAQDTNEGLAGIKEAVTGDNSNDPVSGSDSPTTEFAANTGGENLPPPQYEAQTTAGNEPVAAGSNPCALVANAQYTQGSLTFLIWLLGLAPISLRRFF